ncbi:MAG TPA: IS481 family transposase [Candidatus Nanoarchaeia archaeon]|nr:IS481 family transposase [Candidatus Nanoarchaeia archaeon]
MTKLTNTKMKWIVRQNKKRMPNETIADAMRISTRRVQQIIKEYKHTKIMPILTKSRRPKTYIDDKQKESINLAFDETKLSPRLLYYELIRRGTKVPKNKIYNYLKEKGFVNPNPKLQKQRKRCRYERHHSGSLVHGDSHRTSINHPYCLVWLDDASRKALSGIESKTSINNQLAIKSFKQAEKVAEERNVIIFQVNTDRGPEFFSNKKNMNKDSKSEFELYLRGKGKQHVLSRIKNPQTNGKLERFWQEYDKHRWKFKSLNDFLNWYNNRLHGALKLEWGETPNEAFIRKRRPESILGEFWRFVEHE